MKKTALKRSVDLLMTAVLLALMSYSLIGEAAHERIGMGMALLFTLRIRGWSALAIMGLFVFCAHRGGRLLVHKNVR